MKKFFVNLLLVSVIISVCLAFCGCDGLWEILNPSTQTTTWKKSNALFGVEFKNVKYEGMVQKDYIDFEITSTIYFDVIINSEEVDDSFISDISVQSNSANSVASYAYSNARAKRFCYKIYFFDVVKNDQISISYGGETIVVPYNVLDYDFESHGYVKINSLAYLNKYPEFKDMLMSIAYHQFSQPYVGLTRLSVSTNSKAARIDLTEGTYTPNIADTNYVRYLTDSAYYPTKFNLVLANSIASREVEIVVPTTANVSPGANISQMNSFSIYYSVIDPGCTNPQYPLQSMIYNATNSQQYGYFANGHDYPTAKEVLISKYPEWFLARTVGTSCTMYVCKYSSNSLYATFTDGRYVYEMKAYYTRPITAEDSQQTE